MSILNVIRNWNNLGHPLCNNLREGDWLPQYVYHRLQRAGGGVVPLGNWLGKVFSYLAKLPRFLIPCYFDAIITGVYMVIEEVAWARMPEYVLLKLKIKY